MIMMMMMTRMKTVVGGWFHWKWERRWRWRWGFLRAAQGSSRHLLYDHQGSSRFQIYLHSGCICQSTRDRKQPVDPTVKEAYLRIETSAEVWRHLVRGQLVGGDLETWRVLKMQVDILWKVHKVGSHGKIPGVIICQTVKGLKGRLESLVSQIRRSWCRIRRRSGAFFYIDIPSVFVLFGFLIQVVTRGLAHIIRLEDMASFFGKIPSISSSNMWVEKMMRIMEMSVRWCMWSCEC